MDSCWVSQFENSCLVAVRQQTTSLALLAAIPEEDIWLAGQLSPHTRRAYRQDVADFISTMKIASTDEFRHVGRAAVVAWQNRMKERGDKPRTIRRRLSALASLFTHLIEHRAANVNPVRDIKRPRINRRQGATRAFSSKEARLILDAPDAKTVRGLRDRAILSVGFQAGPRRSEIANLCVRDFHTDSGFRSLQFVRKGGEVGSLALNPQTCQRIEEYLVAAGHAEDFAGPLFRPIIGVATSARRHLNSEAIDRVLRCYAASAGCEQRGYSAHSMRATFITTALDRGASLEDVQRAAGHVDPSTTKLYDRRGYNPEKSAAFFATY